MKCLFFNSAGVMRLMAADLFAFKPCGPRCLLDLTGRSFREQLLEIFRGLLVEDLEALRLAWLL